MFHTNVLRRSACRFPSARVSILLSVMMLSLTHSALADPPPPSALTSGTQVGGSCTTIGQIATPTDLSIVNSNLNAQLTFAGEAITQGLQAQASAFNNTLTALLAAQTKTEEGLLQSQMATDYLNSVTGANAAPTPGSAGLASSPCLMSAAAQSILLGQVNKQAIAQQVYTKAMTGVAPVSSVNAAVLAAAQAGPAAYTPTSIFPDASTPATAASAAAFIRNVVTPVPPASIPASQRDTAAGKIALANLNAMQARQSLAVEALTHVASQHIPSAPASQAIALWQNAGFPGSPPETANNRISSDGMLQVLVDTRFANPEFYKAIYTGGETYALRTYAIELATQLSIQQQQIDSLERLVAVNAAALSAQTAEQRERLDALRAAAAMQTVQK